MTSCNMKIFSILYEFKISLKELNNTSIKFVKIIQNENHPILSDHVYTVDSNQKVTRVNVPNIHNEVILMPIKLYSIYKSN